MNFNTATLRLTSVLSTATFTGSSALTALLLDALEKALLIDFTENLELWLFTDALSLFETMVTCK